MAKNSVKPMTEDNQTQETPEPKAVEWPSTKFRISKLYWITNAVVHAQEGNKLDGDKNGIFDWTGKERYKISKFIQWVNEEIAAAELVKSSIAKKDKDGRNVDPDGPRKFDDYVNTTEATYTGPIIEADEEFFNRVRLPVDVLSHLGGFIKVTD